MTHIAITGSNGFIGKHVLKGLLERDVKITLLVRDRVKHELASHSKVTISQYDLNDIESVSYDNIGSPDVLLHLAWAGLPNYRSLHHFEEEVGRHYLFLKKLIEGGLPKVVATGTCFEYGMQDGKLSENMNVYPDNPYGFAKDSLRRQLEFLQKQKKFGLTWARLFYLWGEGQAAGSLYPLLCSAINENKAVFDMSAGEQTRDYLKIEQVVDYLIGLSIDVMSIGIVNVCSGKPITIKQMVSDWITHKQANITMNLGKYPYPDYEPMHFWGNSEKLEKAFSDVNIGNK